MTSKAVASPCTGVCRIDPSSGCCEGCLRTLVEIAAWSTLDDAARREICNALPLRQRPAGAGDAPARGHP